MQPGIGPPKSLPSAATQHTMHLTPLGPPAGGEPMEVRGSHFASLGKGPGHHRASPPGLGAGRGPGDPHLAEENHEPLIFFFIRGGYTLSGPSSRACLQWVALPGDIKSQTTELLGSLGHANPWKGRWKTDARSAWTYLRESDGPGVH